MSAVRVLGIDIGTSSVKLLVTGCGAPVERSERYGGLGFEDMFAAFLRAARALDKAVPLESIDSAGLSGLAGSYQLFGPGGDVKAAVHWLYPGREPYLERALADLPQDEFFEETMMEQPRLSSYPLPTILSMKDRIAPGDQLLQPKDYFCLRLCGLAATDPYTWRGLAHPERRSYSEKLLGYAGVSEELLPRIAERLALSPEGAHLTGLREGTPIFVGLNDFYASLLGIGAERPGDAFDVTGTSEHFGALHGKPRRGRLIASPFPGEMYVHYGVTGSSGVALTWCRENFGEREPHVPKRAPVFLPYLMGERAPVFDVHARGMLVGLTDQTDAEALRYSVYEGVVFSLLDIHEALGRPALHRILATGGAANSPLLNRMKASIFGCDLMVEALRCGSAMGAAKLAGGEWARETQVFHPETELQGFLLSRYPVYQRLYGAWREVARDTDTDGLF